jgi:P4 family phage/plasmid primase-like protien
MTLETLKSAKTFLLWKYEIVKNGGKPTKVPYCVYDGKKVGVTEKYRDRWADFQTVEHQFNYINGIPACTVNYDGIGFVFVKWSGGLYICGIDIDGHAPDGDFVKGIIAMFPNAYIETTPSGNGIHIIFLADITKVPQYTNEKSEQKIGKKYYSKNPKNGCECYISGLTNRYFTFTGDTIQDGRDVDHTPELLRFLDMYMLRKTDGDEANTAIAAGEAQSILSDDELLRKARAAANGAKFAALFDKGDLSGYNNDDSGADMALMNMLAFWTRCDMAQMERLFTVSALGRRGKWQERGDYRRMTIDRAFNDCKAIYEPPKPSSASEDFTLKPGDFTDVGESNVLAVEYGGVLRHSAATKFIVYNGKVWVENEARARRCLHELTERQLGEHLPMLVKAAGKLESAKENGNNALIAEAEEEYKNAVLYHKFILRCRNSNAISGVMREVQTPLEISVEELDNNPFLLNTPDGEVDLRTGEMLPHNPESYHTKITAVAPSDEGADLWAVFLDTITCGDKGLEDYLQMTSGQEAVGRVYAENMEILHGTGKNGKSTYVNAKGRALGDYVGQISAETLTTGRKTGKNWELAQIRGKRLIIAPELEEGTRLDASFVKKICSTDKITGEKKYKDPFDFEPSHTVALFTNHLPRVGSSDEGTWRRLVVIPFNAKIKEANDVKNYADHLFRNAGGAILKWIVEGARRYIAAGYHIEPPECVKQAIEAYRQQNDWLNNYLSERCEVDKTYKQKSGELYSDYRAYCVSTGDYARSAPDFNAAVENAGFVTKKTKTGAFVYGMRLLAENTFHGVHGL